MSFTRRRIDLTFKLGTGSFGEDGTDTLTLTGLRCSADIQTQGMSMAELDLTVYGMTLDQMNKLTILNVLFYLDGRQNTVTVAAGDDTSRAVVFTGGIVEAWGDPKSQPDVSFHVRAYAGYIDNIRPVPPTSYRGTIDVATALEEIAGKMTPPRHFENNGVNVQLENQYLAGTLGDQIKRLVRAARITVTDDGETLAVFPEGGARDSLGTVEISPTTGMVGYPAFAQNSISVQSLFNPAIKFGAKAKITSALAVASKMLVINQVTHNLDAETPDGAWFTHADLVIEGQEAPVPS